MFQFWGTTRAPERITRGIKFPMKGGKGGEKKGKEERGRGRREEEGKGGEKEEERKGREI